MEKLLTLTENQFGQIKKNGRLTKEIKELLGILDEKKIQNRR